MSTILIGPDSITTPPIDASREEIEEWLGNLQMWLKEASGAQYNWLHAVEATQLLRENGRFPSFETLRSWQRKYKLDINPKLIERDVNAFFRDKDHDALENIEYLADSKYKKNIIKYNYKKDKCSITFWHDRLQNIWDEIAFLPRLGDTVEIHRGMEYNLSVKDNEDKLFSEVPREGFARGLRYIISDFEPYIARPSIYLNMDPELQRQKAYKLPWDKPKVIVNAGRLSTDRWLIAGAIDEEGLIYTQNFHGIWPTGSLPIEVIAALLNGPVANAFLGFNRTSSDNQIRILREIPIPHFTSRRIQLITSLVREYMAIRKLWHTEPEHAKSLGRSGEGIVGRIESEILRFYDLSMDAERELITYFEGYKKPGPIPLTQIESSPQNRLYPSLVRVEDIRGEGDNKIVDIVILGCEYDQVIHLPISLVPPESREKLSQDSYLLAKVNIEAKEEKNLVIEDIELAPEPRLELRERFA
jgi:hypothetical protein